MHGYVCRCGRTLRFDERRRRVRLRPPLHAGLRRRGRRGRRVSPGSAGVAPRVAFGSLADDYREKRTAIDAAIAGVLARGRFVLGEEVARFEDELRGVPGCGPRRRLRQRHGGHRAGSPGRRSPRRGRGRPPGQHVRADARRRPPLRGAAAPGGRGSRDPHARRRECGSGPHAGHPVSAAGPSLRRRGRPRRAPGPRPGRGPDPRRRLRAEPWRRPRRAPDRRLRPRGRVLVLPVQEPGRLRGRGRRRDERRRDRRAPPAAAPVRLGPPRPRRARRAGTRGWTSFRPRS